MMMELPGMTAEMRGVGDVETPPGLNDLAEDHPYYVDSTGCLYPLDNQFGAEEIVFGRRFVEEEEVEEEVEEDTQRRRRRQQQNQRQRRVSTAELGASNGGVESSPQGEDTRARGKVALSVKRQRRQGPRTQTPRPESPDDAEVLPVGDVIVLDDDYDGGDVDMWLREHQEHPKGSPKRPSSWSRVKTPRNTVREGSANAKGREGGDMAATGSPGQDQRPFKRQRVTRAPTRQAGHRLTTSPSCSPAFSASSSRSSSFSPDDDKSDCETESHFDKCRPDTLASPKQPTPEVTTQQVIEEAANVDPPKVPAHPLERDDAAKIPDAQTTLPPKSAEETPPLRTPSPGVAATERKGYALRSGGGAGANLLSAGDSGPKSRMAKFYRPIIEQFHDRTLLDDDEYQHMLDEAEDASERKKKGPSAHLVPPKYTECSVCLGTDDFDSLLQCSACHRYTHPQCLTMLMGDTYDFLDEWVCVDCGPADRRTIVDEVTSSLPSAQTSSHSEQGVTTGEARVGSRIIRARCHQGATLQFLFVFPFFSVSPPLQGYPDTDPPKH